MHIIESRAERVTPGRDPMCWAEPSGIVSQSPTFDGFLRRRCTTASIIFIILTFLTIPFHEYIMMDHQWGRTHLRYVVGTNRNGMSLFTLNSTRCTGESLCVDPHLYPPIVMCQESVCKAYGGVPGEAIVAVIEQSPDGSACYVEIEPRSTILRSFVLVFPVMALVIWLLHVYDKRTLKGASKAAL